MRGFQICKQEATQSRGHHRTNPSSVQHGRRGRSSGTMQTKSGNCWWPPPNATAQATALCRKSLGLQAAVLQKDVFMISHRMRLRSQMLQLEYIDVPISRYCLVSSEVGFAQSSGCRQTAHRGNGFLHACTKALLFHPRQVFRVHSHPTTD